MPILIDKIRIKNFRALQDVEVDLKLITLLVGANNAGKTTLLRALNTVLGVSRNQLNKDDLFIDKDGNQPADSIIIDIRIVPIDAHGQRVATFGEPWRGRLGGQEIFQLESRLHEYVAFRAEYSFGREDAPLPATYKLITDWQSVILGDEFNRVTQIRSLLPMYLIDAQRDLQEDLKLRTSFFGKLVSQLKDSYSPSDVEALEALIQELNEKAVTDSDVLTHLKTKLSELNRTTQTRGAGISINPFSKNIRDLHKGMKVDFQDNGSDSFGMEYHGMGTRSWASILTLGAYLDWELQQIDRLEEAGEEFQPISPLIGLEEPEAHLHPNAQRTLYSQLKKFAGQKIISTHSPYIAGQADLTELRHFYKAEDKAVISQIDLSILDRKEVESIRNNIESSKSEVLFARAVVMCEGETEETALPIFAKAYFGKSNFELGIEFIKTGKYYPLLTLLRFLRIEWFIFSDYDKPDVKSDLYSVLRKNNVSDETVIKLNDETTQKDIEEYLYDEGYNQELRESYKIFKEPVYANEQHRLAKQAELQAEHQRIDTLSKEDFLKELDNWKAKVAHIYPYLILERSTQEEKTPKKIRELFEKISEKLGINPS